MNSAETATAAAAVPPCAGEARSTDGPPDGLPVRIVLSADRVSVFPGGSAAPALSVPCGAFSPDAFPRGAKIVFFGRAVRFRGFSFRRSAPPLPGEGGTAP